MNKKIVTAAVLAVLALLVVPVTMLAHTEADPLVRMLIAGKNDWVGDVLIWNDGSNLYVKYVMDAWCYSCDKPMELGETHLAVATSQADLPQTKSGNAKPGKFPYKHEDLVGALSDLYVIPLSEIGSSGVGPGDTVFIAAHAVVTCCCECEETAWTTGCGFCGDDWSTWFTYEVQPEEVP